MTTRIARLFLGLIWLTPVLPACGLSDTPPTSQATAGLGEASIAATLTQVAIEKAVAATLTAEAAALAPTPTATFTPAPAGPPTEPLNTPPPATETPSTVPTATPALANTPETGAKCTVVSSSLNLRYGPGLAYQPTVTLLAQGTELTPLSYSPLGFPGERWVQVQVLPTNQIGWVNAGFEFISCTIDVTTLPAPAELPPTPTATFTPTPIPAQPTFTPTPTPPSPIAFEPGGGPNRDLKGYIAFFGYTPAQLNVNSQDKLVSVRDKLVFRVVVYDSNLGQTDGQGIRNVRITIGPADQDDWVIYQRTEENAPYCAFGGDDPTCPGWVFAEHNYQWPDGQPIAGDYNVSVNITPHQGDGAQWNWTLRIEAPSEHNQPTPSTLTAEIVQTGPNSDADVVSDALVFQVFASADGQNDGAGIDRVDMRIIGPDGQVHQRTEQNAAYCAFSGGEPDCEVWNFAEHNNQWPNGDPIEPGDHILRATVRADDGSNITLEKLVQIQ